MLARLTSLLSDKKARDVALTAGGMAALLAGGPGKLVGLALFAVGFRGLEKKWREDRQFEGSFSERWQHSIQFYEATHANAINRKLHVVGIPMILGGAVGLLAMPSWTPPWWVAAGSFTAGWALNILGHAKYEKNRPAFADDPLSFFAGPVWDLMQLRSRLRGRAAEPAPLDGEAPEPPSAQA